MKTGQAILLLAICVVAYIELTREETDRVGEGPEPSPGPRFGCTDPFASNWYPQAEFYGSESSGFGQAMDTQVCTYPRLNGYEEAGYIFGRDLASQNQHLEVFDYAQANACYQIAGDQIVVRHWNGNNNPDRIHPLSSCLVDEVMIGVMDRNSILVDVEGTFPDTEHSTSKYLETGTSVLKPKDGQAFDRSYFFEHLVTKTNPGYGPGGGNIPDVWYVSDSMNASATANYLDYFAFFNDQVMEERAEAASKGQFSEYRDNVYGKLWVIGDPKFGNLIDFDFDKNGLIGRGASPSFELGIAQYKHIGWNEQQGNGLMFQTEDSPGIYVDPALHGVPWLTSPNTGEVHFPKPDGSVNDLLQQSDLDHDGMVSAYELMLLHGAADNTAFDVKPRLWANEDAGILGYDGVTCSESENVYDDDANTACFPFSEMSKRMLIEERLRYANDDTGTQWNWLNEPDIYMKSTNAWSTFSYCGNLELGTGQYDDLFMQAILDALPDPSVNIPDFVVGILMNQYCIKRASIVNDVPEDLVSSIILGNIPFKWVPHESTTGQWEGTLTIEIPKGMPHSGEMISALVVRTLPQQFYAGDYTTQSQFLYAAPDRVNSMLEDTADGNYIAGFDHPYAFKGDQQIAQTSCPASHPNFVRFCQTAYTKPTRIAETIDIEYSEETENENT